MKMVIEVSGGVVQAVYTNDLTIEVVLIDWDNDGLTADESDHTYEVTDSIGRQKVVRVVELETHLLQRMSPETKAAFKHTSL